MSAAPLETRLLYAAAGIGGLIDGAAGARLILQGVAAAGLNALGYRACKRCIARLPGGPLSE